MVGRIMLDGPEMWCQNAFLMLIQPDFFGCNILQRILPTKMNQYIYIYIYINQKKFVYPKQLCNIINKIETQYHGQFVLGCLNPAVFFGVAPGAFLQGASNRRPKPMREGR